MNWDIGYGGKLYEFANLSLLDRCRMDICHALDDESVIAIENLDPRYRALMLAIFRQALFDYLWVDDRAYNAMKWIESLEDLSFLGMPHVSGIDIIKRLDSNWEVFYNVRCAVRNFENDTIMMKKRRRKERK